MTVTSKIYIIQENNTNLLVTSVIEQINVVHRLFRRPKKRAGNSTDLKPRFGNPSAGRPRVHTFCKHPFSRQRNNFKLSYQQQGVYLIKNPQIVIHDST